MSYYKPGTWNAICQLCGLQFKSDEIRKRWDGLLVCQNDYETRHPLDFVRATPEHSGVPYTSPEPTDQFVVINYLGNTPLADYAQADRAVVVYGIPTF